MVGSSTDTTTDLLGPPVGYKPVDDVYLPATCAPGQTVDLSGGSSSLPPPQPPGGGSFGPRSGGGSSSFSSGGSHPYGGGFGGGGGAGGGVGFGGASSRGPTSFEGGGGGGLSLNSLAPSSIMRQLASRPVTDLVAENGRQLLNIPRHLMRAYTSAAQRYLQPWGQFTRIRPSRIVQGIRQASRRGEIQIYLQRNVLANARTFSPNYAFLFMCMLFIYVATSPLLLLMLCGVGGGWSHALRDEGFRTRPWTLQIGSIQVPLGSNTKMAILAVPTLLFLNFCMGPVLWSAALGAGGISLAHAAIRDRQDDHDDDDHGLGPRIREVP